MCIVCKEVCWRFSRCNESREVLTRPQLCQICPNQTKGGEKTQAADRGLPNQADGEKTGKVDAGFTIIFSNLVSDRGQRHGSQRVNKAVTISGENHEVLIC